MRRAVFCVLRKACVLVVVDVDDDDDEFEFAQLDPVVVVVEVEPEVVVAAGQLWTATGIAVRRVSKKLLRPGWNECPPAAELLPSMV